MKNNRWTAADIPSMKDKVVIITGANSGLGYYTAEALAAKGATVIMACRNIKKGEAARQQIVSSVAGAKLTVYKLDLADLHSVKTFAKAFKDKYSRLDLLINNAGLMAIPYSRTKDGFEMQFGVNHLGHFALTGLLFDILKKTKNSRIVNVSSLAHRMGKIRFRDINWEMGYKKWKAYGMSKLANLLFTDELSRRLNGDGENITVAAAHPGYADTELQSKGSEMRGFKLGAKMFRIANKLAAQSGGMGALPILYAATAEDVVQAGFYGPSGFMKIWGYPAPDTPKQDLIDPGIAAKLWELSEALTGVSYNF
ncbi:MAG: SDR family NAD(P)-dependent oxidoreductase [Bacteroidales bacterium]|nr:SDR family NAD(P)-dependent oxidoreductase [Bacteroidales bacterium]MBN2698212.1 SDR family NAD(P)-dependent oxidoreductase [Bacteroidales bacterium]